MSQENKSAIMKDDKQPMNIDDLRSQLSLISKKYITTFSKFPLINKIEGIGDIKEIINRNINYEIETRKLQKKISNYLNVINKMLEAGINSIILHQHFLGCLNIALSECYDLLCMKIFLSQAHNTFTEITRYVQEYLKLSKNLEKIDISPLLNFIQPSISFSEQYLKIEDSLLTDIEKIISHLEEIIKK